MPTQEDTAMPDILSGGAMYFSRCEQSQAAKDIVVSFQEFISGNRKPWVILGPHSLDETAITVKEYCLQLFRQHGLHKNDRELVLSEEDQLVALQLTLAERNKRLLGDYDVEMSTVIEFNKKLTSEKLALQAAHATSSEFQEILQQYNVFLESSNVTDFSGAYCQLQAEYQRNEWLRKQITNTDFLVLNAPRGILEVALIRLLSQAKMVYRVQHEISLDDSLPLGNPHFEASTLEAELDTPSVTVSPSTPHFSVQCGTPRPATCRGSLTTANSQGSVSEAYARRILLSYIQLLVNTRSELALAQSINVPDRGIDHQAFTDIKKEAKKKDMPMFQMSSSYIMRLRLGGKSYAPDPNSPLAMHVKGIGEFTDLMHKLQTVMEEDSNPSSAAKRIINIIKNVIIKSRDNSIRRQSVEAIAEELQMCAQQVQAELERTAPNSPVKTAGTGGSLVGRGTQKLLRGLLDRAAAQPTAAADVLTDVFSSQHTPIRFASLLSQFRSPVEHSPESKHEKSLVQRMQKNLTQKQQAAVPRFGACLDWAQPLHSIGLEQKLDDLVCTTVDEYIPSKTLMQPAAPVARKPCNRKVSESATDQENVPAIAGHFECMSTGGSTRPCDTSTKASHNKRTCDTMLHGGQARRKHRKKEAKSKKLLPLPKGQKQLTAFFKL